MALDLEIPDSQGQFNTIKTIVYCQFSFFNCDVSLIPSYGAYIFKLVCFSCTFDNISDLNDRSHG